MPIRLFRFGRYHSVLYQEEELGAAYEHAGVKITELVERTPGIIALYRNSLLFVRIPSTYCRITPFR